MGRPLCRYMVVLHQHHWLDFGLPPSRIELLDESSSYRLICFEDAWCWWVTELGCNAWWLSGWLCLGLGYELLK